MNPGFTTARTITECARLPAPATAAGRSAGPRTGSAGGPDLPRWSAPDGIEPPVALEPPAALEPPTAFEPAGRLDELHHPPAALTGLRGAAEPGDARSERPALLLRAPARPAPHRRPEAGGRIRYFGHACLVLQTPRGAVVTDPFISADGDGSNRWTHADLPDFIDLVLVTHGHHHRIVLETLLRLRGRIGTVVVPRSSRGDPGGPGTGPFLGRLGFPVVEAGDHGEFRFPGGRVVTVPVPDPSGEPAAGGRSAYWVEFAGRSVFIGTDARGTDPEPYRRVRRRLGPVDYAFLAMDPGGVPLTARLCEALMVRLGLAGPDPGTEPGPGAEQAAVITAELGAGAAYVHTCGEEPWPAPGPAVPPYGDPREVQQIPRFMRWCADHGITAGHLLRQDEWRW
ncbi:MBL fold metallo-hydrolase [Streptomyces sp. NPDC003691]